MKSYILNLILLFFIIFFTACPTGGSSGSTNPDNSEGSSYISGEYRTNSNYGYGLYEVRMKATKNIGIVSSFFTYTGPSEGNPHDEIDIEFLGRDTTQVQLNYFTGGVGGNEVMIDLGFDASEDFHTYAFDWQSDSIKWYVDGTLVHTATTNIPTNPGKIMVNLWPGIGVNGWLGAYNGTTPLTAEYDWIKYNTTVIDEGFDNYNTASWHKADGWSNGGFFNCTWRSSQVTFSSGIMTLTLDTE